MEKMYQRVVKGMLQTRRAYKRGNTEGIRTGHKSQNDGTKPAKSSISGKTGGKG